MRNNDYFAPGEHNLICDRTGQKMKSHEARKEWNGLIVHYSVYEERHPQDFVRGVTERPGLRDARPRADLSFLSTNQVTQDSL